MTDYIAWLDLETDGADDYRKGNILEVGVAISDLKLEIVDMFSTVLFANERTLKRMPEVVREMHQGTGLWNACLNSRENIYNADFLLSEKLQSFGHGTKLALAGSGVLHYDKKWVWHHMPRSSRLLTHWGYDVGVVRRVLRDLAGVPLPAKQKGIIGTEHRALDDAVSACLEMKTYVEQLKTLEGWDD